MRKATKINIFGLALAAALFAASLLVQAQPAKKVPVIGIYLPDSAAEYRSQNEAFEHGLRALDYVVGQNIIFEYRYTEGRRDRLATLAAELVSLKVDVIVVTGGTLAATKQATNTIPIVVATAGDLVGGGYIASLARPGGNITGSTNLDSDLSGKRLELVKETFPKINRVAFFSWEGSKGDQEELKETRGAAQRLGMQIHALETKDPSRIQGALGGIIKDRAEALIVTNNSFNFAYRKPIIEFAIKNRLPSMFGRMGFVEDGGLISYAASRLDSFRRAAYFVDKILKGSKPGDLPVQQPTKFELVINLKTAKQIGLTIPPNILVRADKVIR
jgi:putative ABC transport system substrate-binding protein